MKKTRYISIAYLLFITSITLITFIDAKAHENIKRISNNKKELSTQNLNNYKIIVAAKKTRFSIVKDTINQLDEFFYIPRDTMKGNLSKFDKKVVYRLHGDTLFIDKTYARFVTLKAKNIEQIIAKEQSKINISNYTSKKITINSVKGNIQGRKNNFKNLNITATNLSNINFYNSTIDTVNVYSKKSKIYNTKNKTKQLNAILVDNSYIRSNKSSKINIDSDKSSKYDMW